MNPACSPLINLFILLLHPFIYECINILSYIYRRPLPRHLPYIQHPTPVTSAQFWVNNDHNWRPDAPRIHFPPFVVETAVLRRLYYLLSRIDIIRRFSYLTNDPFSAKVTIWGSFIHFPSGIPIPIIGPLANSLHNLFLRARRMVKGSRKSSIYVPSPFYLFTVNYYESF